MNVLSLFSGCGGLDIGLEGHFWALKKSVKNEEWIEKAEGQKVLLRPTGFKTVFANDIRPDAKRAWTNYFKDRDPNIYHLESIVDLVKQAKAGKKTFPNNIDIVTGGFPCQDFSVAGKRLGFNSMVGHDGSRIEAPTAENRGHLYMWMREVISMVKPKMFIAENVKGLTNLGDVQKIIEHDFESAGYIVVPAKVMLAADYGVPQSRERVIFFGFDKERLTDDAAKALAMSIIPDAYDPYPAPTHRDRFVTCGDAFYGLEEPNQTNDPAQRKYSKAKYMGKHCQGQIEVNINGISPTIRSEHHGNIEFRRLSAEHGGKHVEELSKGLKERRLTVRECARIQTFPDNYEFIIPSSKASIGISASNAYKLIGNAVPCLMAYNIAMNLKRKWSVYFKEESQNDSCKEGHEPKEFFRLGTENYRRSKFTGAQK